MLPLLRTAALRRGSAFVTRTTRPIARRNYGNEVHPAKSNSEMPWIIGSLAFTIPTVAYLLSGSPSSSDHSGKHSSQRVTHDAHSSVGQTVESAKQSLSDVATKASEVKDSAKEKVSQVAESAKEKASEVTSAATAKSDIKEEVEEAAESAKETTGEAVEQAKQATGETVERAKKTAGETAEEVKETTSGVAEKAKQTAAETTEAAKEKASELAEKAKEAPHALTERAKATVENIKDKVLPDHPEAPGAERNPRTAAELATIEENKKPYTDVTHAGMGADATSREAGSFNVQSGKQEGLSNSNTWHAELHHGRGKEISKKAEGVHDSAKLKGTVDPKRTGS